MTITLIVVKLLLVVLALGFAVVALNNWRQFHRAAPSKRPTSPPTAAAKTSASASNIPAPPQFSRRRPSLVQSEVSDPRRATPTSLPRSDAATETFDVAAFGRELDTLRRRLDHTALPGFEQAAIARHDRYGTHPSQGQNTAADPGQDPGQVQSYLNDALTTAVRLIRYNSGTSERRGMTALEESDPFGRYLKSSG